MESNRENTEEMREIENILRMALAEGYEGSDAGRIHKKAEEEEEVKTPRVTTAESRDKGREAIRVEETSTDEDKRGGNFRTGDETPPKVTIEERLGSNQGESTPEQKGTNPSEIGGARRVTGLTYEEQKVDLTQIIHNTNILRIKLVNLIQKISREVVSKSSEIGDKARKKLEAATLISKVTRDFNEFILGVFNDFPDYERIYPRNVYERKSRLNQIKIHMILDIEKRLWEILWMLGEDVRYPSEDGKIDIFFTVIPELIFTKLSERKLKTDEEISDFRNVLYRYFKVQTHDDNQGENFPRYTSLTFPMLCIEEKGKLLSKKDFPDKWDSKITEILDKNEITIEEINVCLEVYRFYLLQIFYIINVVKEQYVDVEKANKFAYKLIYSGGMPWILERIKAMESEVNSQ